MKKRHEMPRLDPKERIRKFSEVALGYDKKTAVAEAKRCTQCKKRQCVPGCPVEVGIPEFIKFIAEEKFEQAIRSLKEKNSLPAICGRVCPQEIQCEKVCTLSAKGEPIAVGRLERFIADYERENLESWVPEIKRNGIKVAIAGSGPAGLTCAADLAKMGYEVTVFELLHTTGGVLRYGIPEFRLPKSILDFETDYIRSLGVEILTNVVIGKTFTLDELFQQGFKAVFIGTGAGRPALMGIPGENLNGVYSANEFLTRVNLMHGYEFPEHDTPITVGEKAVVVGGGNTAMDAVRTAKRLGAKDAFIVYRRSEKEMPARDEEIANARAEGIQFHLLTNPVQIIGDDKGWVKGIECIKMELGRPDASGRRRPIPIKGSEFTMDVATVVIAIGLHPNPLVPQSAPGLNVDKWGQIVVDENRMGSIEGVFAGGDIIEGEGTVVAAMGDGKKAARAMDRYIGEK